MWLIYFVEIQFGIEFSVFGILPRELMGLIGIVFSPLIHGSIIHLVSNTLPVLFLGVTLYFFYGVIARDVFLFCYFGTGILVWLFGRSSFHIGASGMIYGMASFLFISGMVRTEFRSLIIAIVVAVTYGGLVYGVLPTIPHISWETHLFGALVGGVMAIIYRNRVIR